MSIPTGSALAGKKKAFNIQRRLDLAFGSQSQDFGALLDLETKIGERVFLLTGWMGSEGKTQPIVAEYTENPERSRDGEHDKPSLRVYTEVDGVLTEIAVAFRKEAKPKEGEEGGPRVFHSGHTTGYPAIELTFRPHIPKAEPATASAQ